MAWYDPGMGRQDEPAGWTGKGTRVMVMKGIREMSDDQYAALSAKLGSAVGKGIDLMHELNARMGMVAVNSEAYLGLSRRWNATFDLVNELNDTRHALVDERYGRYAPPRFLV